MSIKGVKRHWMISIHCSDITSEVLQASRDHPIVVDFRVECCP